MDQHQTRPPGRSRTSAPRGACAAWPTTSTFTARAIRRGENDDQFSAPAEETGKAVGDPRPQRTPEHAGGQPGIKPKTEGDLRGPVGRKVRTDVAKRMMPPATRCSTWGDVVEPDQDATGLERGHEAIRHGAVGSKPGRVIEREATCEDHRIGARRKGERIHDSKSAVRIGIDCAGDRLRADIDSCDGQFRRLGEQVRELPLAAAHVNDRPFGRGRSSHQCTNQWAEEPWAHLECIRHPVVAVVVSTMEGRGGRHCGVDGETARNAVIDPMGAQCFSRRPPRRCL